MMNRLSNWRGWTRFILIGTLASGGCAALTSIMQTASLSPPGVQFRQAILVQAPSRKQLAAYTCPGALVSEGGLPSGAASLACAGLFGAAPTEENLQFAFDLHFSVSNPNQVPLPLAALATAVSVFPETAVSRLGDVCLALCPPEDAACQKQGQSLCQGRGAGTNAVGANLGTFVMAQGIRLASGERLESALPPLSAQENMDVVARFAFVPQKLLPIFAELAKQSFAELRQAKAPTFRIPFKLEGTLSADGGALGALSTPFGPVADTWEVPLSALSPVIASQMKL